MKSIVSVVTIAILASALTFPTFAQDEAKGFHTGLAAGLSLNDGNNDNMQANLSLISEGEKEGLGSIRMGIEGNYGESTVDDETDTTAENIRAFIGTKRTLTECTFLAGDFSVLYDNVAEIDYRAVVSIAPGTFLTKNESTKVSVEFGPAYVWEDVADISDDHAALRLAQRVDHQFSETAKIWESVEYIPDLEDFDRYLIVAEIGAEAALNAHMNLRVVLQDRYDSAPGEGLEYNDLSLISGISVSF
jgi:putative salt-induced outer membrane protein YdiY